MRQVALLVFVLACKQSMSGDDYPVLPPDQTVDPNPSKIDAAVGDASAVTDAGTDAPANAIAGRVCLLTDARAQTTCKSAGAGGLTVTIGTQTATTAANGAFTIATPTGTNLVWHVTGTSLQTSVMPFGSVNQIPAMLAADYLTLEGDNGASVQSTAEGEVFVRVLRSNAPLANARGGSAPNSDYGPLYDSTNALVWASGANQGTGAAGIVWFPGITAGTTTLSITPVGGTLVAVTAPVEGQAITWIVVDVP